MARISAGAPVDRVEVIKNGEIVFTKRTAGANLSSKARVLVRFESDSEPYARDNPRGYRTWSGTLEVRQGQLAAFRAYFDNRHTEFARRDTKNGNRLEFLTETRGRPDVLELDLEEASPSTSIEIRLEETTESGASPAVMRPAATIAASVVNLAFSDLQDGVVLKEVGVRPFRDTVSLELVDPGAARDLEIDFSDRGEARAGDYYYVRVTQLNGNRAWSSPVWVGVEPAR
jgi:hypothetical protein